MQYLRVVVINLFSILFFSSIVCAQPILMGNEAGNFDNGRAIATDSRGNIYVTGSFLSDTLIMDSVILSNHGGHDMFLVKYNSLGKVLWAKNMSGGGDEKGLAIAIDNKGHIFISGCFSASFTYDSLAVNNRGQWDMFVAKHDSMGNVLWIHTGGGKQNEYGQGISIDQESNVYVGGSFNSPLLTMESFTLANSSNKSESMDVFLVKYDNSGRLLWAKSAGGKMDEGGMAVTADLNNNVFITGYFDSPSLTFGSIILKNINSKKGSFDTYLAKYDASGNVVWAKSFGGKYDDGALGICSDKEGNLYITGYFDNEGVILDTTVLSSNGGSDIFLVKYNASGKVQWAKNIGDIGDESGLSLCTDGQSNIFITGYFNSEEITLGSTTFYSKNKSDVYLVKYDSSGNMVWATQGGGASDEGGLGICADIDGNIFITGYFDSGILPFESAVLFKKSLADMFTVKYNPAGKVLWAKKSDGKGGMSKKKIETASIDNTLVGRIIFNAKMDEGVAGAKLFLLNKKGKTIKTATTDNYGIFIFKDISEESNISLSVMESAHDFFNQKKIYLANVDNTVIGVARKNKKDFFLFENLSADWRGLPELVEKDSVNEISFSGNLYAGEERMPLGNLKVNLLDEKRQVVQTVFTNSFGSFTFANVMPDGRYAVALDTSDKRIGSSEIYFTNKQGAIVSSKEGRLFRFELLPSDKNTLSLLQVKDAELLADVRGKICTDANGKHLVSKCIVKVVNEHGEEVGKALTDSLGNFWITGVSADEYYLLKLEESENVLKLSEIFVTDAIGKMVGKLKSSEGKFFRFEFLPMDEQSLSKIYFEDTNPNSLFDGKLLFNPRNGQGIPNTKVSLLNPDGTILQTAMTDEKGMFLFKHLPSGQNFNVKVYEMDDMLINQDKIYLADKTNRVVSRIIKGESGLFVFQNLPPQLNTLTTLVEKDTSVLISFSGNLYIGDERMPIENLKVNLLDDKGQVAQSVFTNSFGSFTFSNIILDERYAVVLDTTDKRVVSSKIYFTNKQGAMVASAEGHQFRFELFPADRNTLSLLQVKDAELLADVRGKICSDAENKRPVAKCVVKAINGRGEEVGKATTDSLGNFWITGVAADEYYLLKLEEVGDILNLNEIFMADANGKVVGKLKSAEGKFFRFEFLPMDKQTLTSIYVDDPWLKVAKMQAEARKDSMFIIENIYYEYQKWNLLSSAFITLNKVINVMKNNPDISMEVISHTDSRGADDFNLSLSQKRSASAVNYIVSKGINKKRIAGIGKGESQLLNNCDDGVECMEEEHAKNRRTEFKITRNIKKAEKK